MLSRFFNTPLALHSATAEKLHVEIARIMRGGHLVGSRGAELRAAFQTTLTDGSRKPYDVIGGIAVIPVRGVLLQEGFYDWWDDCWYGGYDSIRLQFLTAIADPDVSAIAFDVKSPGGMVSGMFDLADEIFAARGQKPIWAICAEYAFSSAYALASAADRIIVPRTGGVGSIGVYCMHVDYSKMLDERGYKVTFIQFGAQKTDGKEEKPLSAEALKRFQADVDATGELFVATVARNRNLSVEAVRGTEAATFQGENGVKAGLADQVMAPDAAFRALLAEIS